MRIQIIGCGDAFGSGGRYNTCFLVDSRKLKFLIDCGATSLVALKRFGVEPDDIDAVFLSHLHGDHFGGLVFLIRAATLLNTRQRRLTIVGPPGTRERLMAAIEVFFPGGSRKEPEFVLEVIELTPNEPATIRGVEIMPFLVEHQCGAPPFALRLTVDGNVIAYSGDTEWTDALIEVGHQADLFICEAYFRDLVVPNHTSLCDLEARLNVIRPKRLLLTHMNDDMIGRLADIPYEAAEDGQVLEL